MILFWHTLFVDVGDLLSLLKNMGFVALTFLTPLRLRWEFWPKRAPSAYAITNVCTGAF
jgi:hypothetical protein